MISNTSGALAGSEIEEIEIIVWSAEIIDGLIAEWRIHKSEV
jgi:hypothetical protein